MADGRAVKTFDIRQYSDESLWYVIEVRFLGKLVEQFSCPTMKQTLNRFYEAGYMFK